MRLITSTATPGPGLTLVLMGEKLLVLIGWGVESTPPPILFVKTIEKVIRLCTVLIFFQLSFDGGWGYSYS